TFALNYKFGGQEVWGYHLVNLLLHLLNGILIYFVAKKLFSKAGVNPDRVMIFSLLAAAFFLTHPVQTESVTYISSRSELLSTAFYLIALLAVVHQPAPKMGFLFSLLIGVIFLLGLGAKETVISLPAAILLYDWLFESNGRIGGLRRRWRFYI